ncbi:MAG: DNA topoisomerase IV subunit B, partial [Actinobacteria bacterium]|nr:DNA topoisomerase IV subunit B [Actinomycetota bacterium]
MPAKNTTYNASSITVLEGLAAVRKRPGMYIGSTGERGLHHLVYEVVDNAVDEAMAGYCTDINVTLMPDGSLKVIDNGRGIPVDMHPTEKKPALEIVMTVLHAGGKFGDGGYSVSGGLHGVGISVVNALSSDLSVIVQRDGFSWSQDYQLGVPTADVKKGEPSQTSGTSVQFWPSKEIFETTDFSFETLSVRLREMAFLNQGLTITLKDERAGHVDEKGEQLEVRYHYEGGITDFVRHLNLTRGETHKSIISFSANDPKQRMALEVSMQWNTGFSESVYTFANAINTQEGGTHEEGFRTALTSIVNKFGEEWGF